MNEIRRDEIIYEEGWRDSAPSADTAMSPSDAAEPGKTPEKRGGSGLMLITVQLIICLIAALTLFILKATDSEIYREFIGFYHDELNKPLISQAVFESIDIGGLFESGVEVSATDDEVPRG